MKNVELNCLNYALYKSSTILDIKHIFVYLSQVVTLDNFDEELFIYCIE
jgi:hypothetical protein